MSPSCPQVVPNSPCGAAEPCQPLPSPTASTSTLVSVGPTQTPRCAMGGRDARRGTQPGGGDSPRCPPCPQMVPCPRNPTEEGGRAARLQRFLPARGVPAPSPKPHRRSHSVTGSPEDPILGVLPAPPPPAWQRCPGRWQRLGSRHGCICASAPAAHGALPGTGRCVQGRGGGNTHHHTGQAAAAPAPYRFGVPQRVAPSAPVGPSGMRGGIRVAWRASAPRDPAPRGSASPVLGCV